MNSDSSCGFKFIENDSLYGFKLRQPYSSIDFSKPLESQLTVDRKFLAEKIIDYKMNTDKEFLEDQIWGSDRPGDFLHYYVETLINLSSVNGVIDEIDSLYHWMYNSERDLSDIRFKDIPESRIRDYINNGNELIRLCFILLKDFLFIEESDKKEN